MPRIYDWTEFPKTIFGLTCPQHRVGRIQRVVRHYGVFNNKATKPELIQDLLQLRRTITKDDDEVIRTWFLDMRHDLDPAVAIPPHLHSGEGTWRGRPYLVPEALSITIKAPRKKANLRSLLSSRAKAKRKPPTGVTSSTPVLVSEVPECSVCMEDLSQINPEIPIPTVTATCKHSPTICSSCATQSIDLQIRDGAWNQISCPGCPEKLDYEEVKNLASVEAFNRYLHSSTMSVCKDIPNFMMCLGPNCTGGQEHEDGDARPIMTCNTCQFKSCFIHKISWHEGQTCSQYDEAQKERLAELESQEAASMNYLEKSAKVCPNATCGLHVTKVSGCDHVTCHRCTYEFCWQCLASYEAIRKEGNAAHAETCIYHTNQLSRVAD